MSSSGWKLILEAVVRSQLAGHRNTPGSGGQCGSTPTSRSHDEEFANGDRIERGLAVTIFRLTSILCSEWNFTRAGVHFAPLPWALAIQ